MHNSPQDGVKSAVSLMGSKFPTMPVSSCPGEVFMEKMRGSHVIVTAGKRGWNAAGIHGFCGGGSSCR